MLKESGRLNNWVVLDESHGWGEKDQTLFIFCSYLSASRWTWALMWAGMICPHYARRYSQFDVMKVVPRKTLTFYKNLELAFLPAFQKKTRRFMTPSDGHVSSSKTRLLVFFPDNPWSCCSCFKPIAFLNDTFHQSVVEFSVTPVQKHTGVPHIIKLYFRNILLCLYTMILYF